MRTIRPYLVNFIGFIHFLSPNRDHWLPQHLVVEGSLCIPGVSLAIRPSQQGSSADHTHRLYPWHLLFVGGYPPWWWATQQLCTINLIFVSVNVLSYVSIYKERKYHLNHYLILSEVRYRGFLRNYCTRTWQQRTHRRGSRERSTDRASETGHYDVCHLMEHLMEKQFSSFTFPWLAKVLTVN